MPLPPRQTTNNGKDCSVGCGCRNCDNYAQEEERKDTENELTAIAIDEDLGNEKRRDLYDIMEWVFGDEVGDSDKYSKGAFALATRFDQNSIQFHRNPIRSTWILSALTKLLTAHDFVTSRPAYVSREFAVSVLLHRAMTFNLLLLTSLLLPSFT